MKNEMICAEGVGYLGGLFVDSGIGALHEDAQLLFGVTSPQPRRGGLGGRLSLICCLHLCARGVPLRCKYQWLCVGGGYVFLGLVWGQ